MKDLLNFFEKILAHNLFVFIIGIILVFLAASSGIKIGSFQMPLDTYGRVILLVLGIGIILSFTIYNMKKQQLDIRFKYKIEPIYTDKPVLITAKNANKKTISSEFIFWDKCSILIWVKIPKQNEGIRNSPANKYVLAHHNGAVNNKDSHTQYFNEFTLRHDTSNHWNISVSDSNANYIDKISLPDNLNEGWHHFFITWDKIKKDLVFQIRTITSDLKESQVFPDRFKFWTEYTNEEKSVTVGAYQSNYAGHYCETELFNLTIYNSFLTDKDSQFKDHISRKPLNI